MVGPGHVAQPDLRALLHLRDVFDSQRGPVLGLQDGILDVLHTVEEPQRANVHLLHADSTKLPPALILLLDNCCSTWPMLSPYDTSLFGSTLHLVLPYRAAEVGNIHYIENGFELLEQDPVLDRPQFHQVVSGVCASYRVPIDLASGAPVRSDLRLQVLSAGQIDLRQPLQHLLPVPVVHGAVVEDHDDEREAEDGL